MMISKKMIKKWSFIMTIFSFLLFPLQPLTFALSILTMDESLARGSSGSIPEIDIPTGHSVNVNFASSGYSVYSVWVDNPSQISITTDTILCSRDGHSNNCGSASLVRIVRLPNPIRFPSNQSRSFGRQSLMTVMAVNQNRESVVYQFLVNLIDQQQSDYSMISLVPAGNGAINSELQSRFFANTIRTGIAVARREDRIDSSDPEWKNVDRFIDILSTGTSSIEQAIVQSNVSRRLVNELATLGRE